MDYAELISKMMAQWPEERPILTQCLDAIDRKWYKWPVINPAAMKLVIPVDESTNIMGIDCSKHLSPSDTLIASDAEAIAKLTSRRTLATTDNPKPRSALRATHQGTRQTNSHHCTQISVSRRFRP